MVSATDGPDVDTYNRLLSKVELQHQDYLGLRNTRQLGISDPELHKSDISHCFSLALRRLTTRLKMVLEPKAEDTDNISSARMRHVNKQCRIGYGFLISRNISAAENSPLRTSASRKLLQQTSRRFVISCTLTQEMKSHCSYLTSLQMMGQIYTTTRIQ